MKARQNYKALAQTLTGQVVDLQKKADEAEGLRTRIKVMESENHALENRLGAATVAKQQLKALLGDAYDQISAQRGYIDRALEDDAVRELGVSREQPVNPMPKESRRRGPQPMLMRVQYEDGDAYGVSRTDRNSRPQPTPWHSL